MKYEEKSDLHEFSMAYSYDELNRVSGVEEGNNGIHRSTVYTYDDSSRVTKSQTENTSRNYTYDGYGRVSQITTKEGSIQIKSDVYSYSSGSMGTSGQISQHVMDTAGYDKTYNYTYDDNGNIVSISDGSNSITYEYDSANQLIRENNQEGGYTYTWTYNNAGNILNRKEYAYTTGTLGTATDTIGNLTADENYTYTWKHGRELQRISSGIQFWTMTYDANGMRTKRESNSTTYEYVYSGSLLSSMKSHNSSTGDRSWFYFIYDAGGLPMAVEYKGTLYYYVTNLQGNVIAIINSSGNQVVGYRYDAWGNVLTVSGSMSTTLGKENPLRYRGYVFDRETNLYYLESRYYNPKTGRFLNADGYTATGQGFVGNNMYAYCGNNPVNRIDPKGELGIGIAIIAGLVCATLVGCGKKLTFADEPYSTAEAARAFSEEVYSTSAYIHHEIGAEIYARTNGDKTTYNYNSPRIGSAHNVSVGDSVPIGTTMVAFVHTHTTSNEFSLDDKKIAVESSIDAYLVGPNLELQIYNKSLSEPIALGPITPIELTDSRKGELSAQYKVAWEAHLKQGCDFNCNLKNWTTP